MINMEQKTLQMMDELFTVFIWVSAALFFFILGVITVYLFITEGGL